MFYFLYIASDFFKSSQISIYFATFVLNMFISGQHFIQIHTNIFPCFFVCSFSSLSILIMFEIILIDLEFFLMLNNIKFDLSTLSGSLLAFSQFPILSRALTYVALLFMLVHF